MRTIAFRFADNYAPPCGTIKAHEQIIQQKGYVWFGKVGSAISANTQKTILENKTPKILLIHSGHAERYWALVKDINKFMPPHEYIPEYYKDKYDNVGTWFCITEFKKAEKDILTKCTVVSSGVLLSDASKKSLSPMFVINYEENQEV